MQGIDNLTRIRGRVRARGPDPRRTGWDVVEVAVEDAAPVAGRADLLSGRVGGDLAVSFRRELLAGADPGARLTFRARSVPEGAVAEPYPADGDLRVEPA
ncbi:hypothetical protein [Blastococcus sp. URHD0036]|uniref:hypothetical protein n=1 Tax=Blastococcus sp. URHD0036 TaxID=1380356 RepID=UPI0012DDDB7C|nr:hypothetical protein [Blastococcus sp. URHD0036]